VHVSSETSSERDGELLLEESNLNDISVCVCRQSSFRHK
jgi:hypothetical protein